MAPCSRQLDERISLEGHTLFSLYIPFFGAGAIYHAYSSPHSLSPSLSLFEFPTLEYSHNPTPVASSTTSSRIMQLRWVGHLVCMSHDIVVTTVLMEMLIIIMTNIYCLLLQLQINAWSHYWVHGRFVQKNCTVTPSPSHSFPLSFFFSDSTYPSSLTWVLSQITPTHPSQSEAKRCFVTHFVLMY